jgi:hypothetical protein
MDVPNRFSLMSGNIKRDQFFLNMSSDISVTLPRDHINILPHCAYGSKLLAHTEHAVENVANRV